MLIYFFFHHFVLANSTFPRTLAIRFWKSWGLKDGDIKGLQSGAFPWQVHICMETGTDETQLVCGEMALGSRMERGLLSCVTYLLILVSYLCAMKRRHFFWHQSFKNLQQKCFECIQDSQGIFWGWHTDTVCCWRWIFPCVQMPNAKTFLSSASIKIVPRHAGWAVPRKALIFIFRGCVQTFVPLSSCRDAESLNSLFCIISSCTGDRPLLLPGSPAGRGHGECSCRELYCGFIWMLLLLPKTTERAFF